jgi:amidase
MSGVLNTCPLDLTGHPALSVPSGIGDHDLPTALQIIGPRFGEESVYQAGFAFEEAVGPLPPI